MKFFIIKISIMLDTIIKYILTSNFFLKMQKIQVTNSSIPSEKSLLKKN